MRAAFQLELPLRDSSLVVSRLAEQDGVNHAGDSWVRQREISLAKLAADARIGVVSVSVCVDATGLADSQLCDSLRWLVLTFSSLGLRGQLYVNEDGVLRVGVVSLLMVVTYGWVGAGANEASQANVQTVCVFLSG